jgi:acyl-CoA thioester hydrolase
MRPVYLSGENPLRMKKIDDDGGSAENTNGVTLTLRVRYAETDQMGVVHHANYLVWFEAARSEFCRVRGIDYSQMERDGLIMPLVEAHVRYSRPAFYEDLITVHVKVLELKRSLLRLQYEVKRGEELLVTGETLQMLVEKATSKPRRFTPEIAERFSGEQPAE